MGANNGSLGREYDALLVVSFGGPNQREDVIPFLEHVLRGKNVPRERMLEVAEHYYHFGGKSPINEQNLALIAAVREELAANGPDLPVYWGNRNWDPLLPETLAQMRKDGVRRALSFHTSAWGSYSGCRQYRENVLAAQEAVGEGAPEVQKLRHYFNHPGFIEPMAERVADAMAELGGGREDIHVVFTAHSVPMQMARTSKYPQQLEEASRLVAEQLGHSDWRLVYQSRSGPPQMPWLEPDVCDYLEEYAKEHPGGRVVIAPVGFISDHMEVLYDLDTEAKDAAARLGLSMARAGTVGTHPRFVSMVRELIVERMTPGADRPALGTMGPSHDVCPVDCCPAPVRPGRPAARPPAAP